MGAWGYLGTVGYEAWSFVCLLSVIRTVPMLPGRLVLIGT